MIEADLVVLAAGGFGTPAILGRSGIACEPRLFVDPVLTVAARWPGAWQVSELPMPFVVQGDHYILSPYFDWLSFLTEPAWRVPAADLVGVMVKLADEPGGTVSGRRIHKRLTALDRRRLDEGAGLATEILRRFGAAPDSIMRGTLNAGHPGGMLPLTAASAATFHDDRLPANVYVADASLFPASLGNPPSSRSSPWPSGWPAWPRPAANPCRARARRADLRARPSGLNARRAMAGTGSGDQRRTASKSPGYRAERPCRTRPGRATIEEANPASGGDGRDRRPRSPVQRACPPAVPPPDRGRPGRRRRWAGCSGRRP